MAISNQDPYIDGQEATAEINRLKDELDEKTDERNEAEAEGKSIEWLEEELDDIQLELKPLLELEENLTYFSLWAVQFIREDEFENYCERFAIDCGDISEESGVYAYVDWERYADGIRIDYTSITYNGEEYLYHS